MRFRAVTTPTSAFSPLRFRATRFIVRGSTREDAWLGHTKISNMPNTRSMPRMGAGDNKKIALIISVLALFLAFSETFGKSAQTAALNLQIEASNLWNFMQAKTIRRTFTIVQGEAAKIEAATTRTRPRKAALDKQIDEWTKTAARYQSEPEAGGGKGEGTRELLRRALEKEKDAISSSTSTITSNSPRRPSRSVSCSRQPPSSPASSALAYAAMALA